MIEVEITYKGVDIKVIGDYSPEEPMVMYYPDGSGYPGSASELEIDKIMFNNVDVYDIYASLDQIWDIEEEAIKEYEENNEPYYEQEQTNRLPSYALLQAGG